MSSKVAWWEGSPAFKALKTGQRWQIAVTREAIPLVFVPGIMGSRLRLGGTEEDPKVKWDPDSKRNMARLLIASPSTRKAAIIGDDFSKDFLEVDDSRPIGDGSHGIISMNYDNFLDSLRGNEWGPLNRLFTFPVYAFGYNWTDSCGSSGSSLARRIKDIIREANNVTGCFCRRVILITHSMGGLVARSASELAGARESILGIIHGVQPVNGAPEAYVRIKIGFHTGDRLSRQVLGPNGPAVGATLAHMPGGLELLPTSRYSYTSDGRGKRWLGIDGEPTEKRSFSLPGSGGDPWKDIYAVPCRIGRNFAKIESHYWGLVDPDMLYRMMFPLIPSTPTTVGYNLVASRMESQRKKHAIKNLWANYIRRVREVRNFHKNLGLKIHPCTFAFCGTGVPTTGSIHMSLEVQPRGRTTGLTYKHGSFEAGLGEELWKLNPVLVDGDGTVPVASGKGLDAIGVSTVEFKADHESAYESSAVQEFVFRCILKLCSGLIADPMKDSNQRCPNPPRPPTS